VLSGTHLTEFSNADADESKSQPDLTPILEDDVAGLALATAMDTSALQSPSDAQITSGLTKRSQGKRRFMATQGDRKEIKTP
jgi:hypothetical protein